MGSLSLAFAGTLGFVSAAFAEVTFDDVEPLLQRNCQECHRPGQIAPMSFLTYEETRPWAESIRENVASRTMPPWHADSHDGEFKNDRSLSQEEIETFIAWADSGAVRGKKSEAPAPAEPAGFSIGEPDLVLTMQEEYEVSAEGTDEYIYFTIPTNLTEDRYVKAVEVRPGNNEVVHHVLAYVQAGGTGVLSRSSEAANEDVGYPFFFNAGEAALRVLPEAPVYDDGCTLPDGGSATPMEMTEGPIKLISTFAPGSRGDVYPEGLGKLIPKGSEILFQVHYNKTGKVERDRTSIALIFTDEPPPKIVEAYWVSNYYFRIPPGTAAHEVKGCYAFDKDVEILSYFPHMHVRGKDMKIEALYPGGGTEVLRWSTSGSAAHSPSADFSPVPLHFP
ncbi:MAG: hypothetical protein L0191_18600, partial [Acidobacteria bacterium]|nr:hypothetical protein [Acidobacteriota bacterium]